MVDLFRSGHVICAVWSGRPCQQRNCIEI